MLLGEAGGFGAEEQGITVVVGDLGVPRAGAGGEGEDAGVGERRKAGVEVRVDRDVREVVVVQARPPQVLLRQVKTQRLHQMQVRARAGAHPDRVTRVRGNDGVVEDDVQSGHIPRV